MSKEGLSLQYDMFSGDLVDARSNSQKKKDRERDVPPQLPMFKTPEMVQFGNQTHSAYKEWFDQATPPALALEVQDVCTPEEIDRNLQREAEKLTISLFAATLPEPTVPNDLPEQPQPLPISGIVFDAHIDQKLVGLRAKLRAQQICGRVRLRSA